MLSQRVKVPPVILLFDIAALNVREENNQFDCVLPIVVYKCACKILHLAVAGDAVALTDIHRRVLKMLIELLKFIFEKVL